VEVQNPSFISFFHSVFSFDDCRRLDEYFKWQRIHEVGPTRIFDIRGAAHQRAMFEPSVYITRFSEPTVLDSPFVEPQGFIENVALRAFDNVVTGGCFLGSTVHKVYTFTNSCAYSTYLRPVTRVINWGLDRRDRICQTEAPPGLPEIMLNEVRRVVYSIIKQFHNFISKQPWVLNLAIIISLIALVRVLGVSWKFWIPLVPMAFGLIRCSF